MVREIVKVSFILIILIQFQTGSYNFLHASQYLNGQQVSIMPEETQTSNNSWRKQNDEERVLQESMISLDDLDGHIEISRKMDQQEIIMFEQKLMRLVGLKKRPVKDKEKVKIPNHLVKLYEDQIKSDIPTSNLNLPGRLTRTANTVRSFYNSGNEPDLVGGNILLRFDLSSVPVHEQITGAELRIPITWEKIIEKSKGVWKSVQIIVHDVVKIPKPTSKQKSQGQMMEPITYPIDTKSIYLSGLNSTLWLTFDVFPALSRWNRKARVELAIEVIGKKGQKLPEITQNGKKLRFRKELYLNSDEASPMLLTYSDDGQNPKKTRDAKTLSRHYRSVQTQRRRRNHRHKNRRRNLCSRKKMFVDFTDVGWNDWIVAPPGYQAYYCSGECPFPMADHLNATNHAVIQALVNSMNPRLVPPPCCVPNKYTSLSLLYTDSSDRIVLKNYNEMIVDSCGCS